MDLQLPDFSDCESTSLSNYCGHWIYGTRRPDGNPGVVFGYINQRMPEPLLRTIWCCIDKQIGVTLNYGLCTYSPGYRLRNADKQHMWMPWPAFTKTGWLSVGEHGELWIGSYNKRNRTDIANVLAVRIVRGLRQQPLYEAPKYVRPVFVLTDTPNGRQQVTYGHVVIAQGRTRRFAVNAAAKLGATLVDRTAAAMAALPPLPNRLLRLRGVS